LIYVAFYVKMHKHVRKTSTPKNIINPEVLK
jgi:hypothetical protein